MKTYSAFLAALIAILSGHPASAGNATYGTGAGENLTSGDQNVLIGEHAGMSLTSGTHNSFLGDSAGTNQTTAADNTFIGSGAGAMNSTGADNTFVGKYAGQQSNASDNTFIGCEAGLNNINGVDNTFVGEEAGNRNTTGRDNTFIGEDAGYNNTTGVDNTALGSQSLRSCTVGSYNTAVGSDAGHAIGSDDTELTVRNTAVGNAAGVDIERGNSNTMIGDNAGAYTEHADFNTFVGQSAGFNNNRERDASNANRNTAVGAFSGLSNRDGEDNVWIGTFADSGSWINGFSHVDLVEDMRTGSKAHPAIRATSSTASTLVHRTTVIGGFASASRNDSVAIGYNARADKADSITIGSGAENEHTGSILIGCNTVSHGDHMAVIGNDSTIGLHPGSDGLTDLGAPDYRFNTIHAEDALFIGASNQAATVVLWADDGAADSTRWDLVSENSGELVMQAAPSGNKVLTLYRSGNISVAGDITVNSDARLKHDIRSIDGALQLVAAMDGKTYEWNPDLGRMEGRRYGLVAQEVEAVVPELVTASGNEGIKSVNYQGCVPILINAVNELREQNERLRQELALQRALLAELKGAEQ